MMNRRNLLHIEMLRIIAIYLVMFNHTGERGYTFFSLAQDSPLYWFYMFFSVACKAAVPIFFMISGALLLGKEESIGELYRKRVLRFLGILVVISFIYYVYDALKRGLEFSLQDYFTTMYSTQVSVALWFLYSYLAMLVMLPLLRLMVKGMRGEHYLYLALWQVILTGVIPMAQYCLSHGTLLLNPFFNPILITAQNVFYVIMGYYFEHILEEKYYTGKNLLAGIALSFAAIAVSCAVTQYQIKVDNVCNPEILERFFNCLIAIPTFTAYFGAKYFFKKHQPAGRSRKLIETVGGTTFGIFLLEGILRDSTKSVRDLCEPYIKSFPACLVWILVALLLGAAIVWLLKKIPGVKRWI